MGKMQQSREDRIDMPAHGERGKALGRERFLVDRLQYILRQLAREPVCRMIIFDVKDAEDGDGKLYRKQYIAGTQRVMNTLGGLSPENWEEMSPGQKLCVYRASGSSGVDCDAGLRSVILYALSYDLLEKGWRIEPQRASETGPYQLRSLTDDRWVLRGDTMNSFAITTHTYFRKVFTRLYQEKLESRGIIEHRGRGNRVYLSDRYDSKKYYLEQAILHQYDIFCQGETSEMKRFFSQVHTLGNFCPVPFQGGDQGEFNGPRGLGASMDYWDLTLACIYNYYADQEQREVITRRGERVYTLEWLLRARESDCAKREQKTRANVTLCKEWLDTFGSWNSYVKRNFFQDFVCVDRSGWGKPKELWENHFEAGACPGTELSFRQFFSHSADWSMRRGRRIAMKAKRTIEKQDLGWLARQLAGVIQ